MNTEIPGKPERHPKRRRKHTLIRSAGIAVAVAAVIPILAEIFVPGVSKLVYVFARYKIYMFFKPPPFTAERLEYQDIKLTGDRRRAVVNIGPHRLEIPWEYFTGWERNRRTGIYNGWESVLIFPDYRPIDAESLKQIEADDYRNRLKLEIQLFDPKTKSTPGEWKRDILKRNAVPRKPPVEADYGLIMYHGMYGDDFFVPVGSGMTEIMIRCGKINKRKKAKGRRFCFMTSRVLTDFQVDYRFHYDQLSRWREIRATIPTIIQPWIVE